MNNAQKTINSVINLFCCDEDDKPGYIRELYNSLLSLNFGDKIWNYVRPEETEDTKEIIYVFINRDVDLFLKYDKIMSAFALYNKAHMITHVYCLEGLAEAMASYVLNIN